MSINPVEVIITIVNFLLLYFLLKHFLFDPVTRFTEARDARIAAGKEAEQQAQEALKAAEAQAEAERTRAEAEARTIQSRERSADLRYANEQHRKAEDLALEIKKEKMQAARQNADAARAEITQQSAGYAEALADSLFED